MTAAFARISESSTSTGTGSIALGGAEAGFRTFGAALADGAAVQIVIEAVDGSGAPTGQWEICESVFTAPATLSRGALIASSTGARINFAAGGKRVFTASLDFATAGAAAAAMYFGTGTDGNLTASNGDFFLSTDAFYNNVTLSGTARIFTNGHRLFIAGTLDLTGYTGSHPAISRMGVNGNNGSAGTGGGGGSLQGAGTLTETPAGGAGANGGNGAGSTGSFPAIPATKGGGNAGARGAGGTGTGGAGGSSAGGAVADMQRLRWASPGPYWRGTNLINGGFGGPGGSSGGGSGSVAGGGGGGGGGAGGGMYVGIRRLMVSATTPSGAISARGGNGGNGASRTADAGCGGGGGGAGGGGGFVIAVIGEKTGPVIANLIDANGGAGGNGGDAGAGATGGQGGAGGGGGQVNVWLLSTGQSFVAGPGNSPSLPAVPSGTAGTAGVAGSTAAVTL